MPEPNRGPYRSGGPMPPRGTPSAAAPALFDPSKPDVELYDTLAERQASLLEVNSSQLRKFFGEVKELYRQFEALTAQQSGEAVEAEIYQTRIEPRFKMLRSKVQYASRRGAQGAMSREFATFLTSGIEKVKDHRQFRKFVLHFEAVVGFMYGSGKVK